MSEINSLSDLLMEELADLMDAEEQLVQALPDVSRASESPGLKAVIDGHAATTEGQVRRLKSIFANAGQNPKGISCKTIKALIAEIRHIAETTARGTPCDTAIISVLQRIEHYQITGYAIAQEHADDLGHSKIVALLDKTLNEERMMHLNLSELAQNKINEQATRGKGFYVPDGRIAGKLPARNRKNPANSRFSDPEGRQ